MNGCLGGFQCQAISNSAVNIPVYVFGKLILGRYIPGILGHRVIYVQVSSYHQFSYWLYQFIPLPVEYRGLSFYVFSSTLSTVCFSQIAMLVSVQWHSIFLMTCEVDHLFLYLLAIRIISSLKFLFKSFVYHLLDCLPFFLQGPGLLNFKSDLGHVLCS